MLRFVYLFLIFTHFALAQESMINVQLEVREGLVYQKGTQVPYSGRFEQYYSQDQIKIRGQYAQGLMTGEWSYFYANGKLEGRGHFLQGDGSQVSEVSGIPRAGREGEWLFYHENGQASSKQLLKNGKLIGHMERWWPNGQLRAEGHYVDGKPHGTFNGWHDNGQRSSVENYKHGLSHGLIRLWTAEGDLFEEWMYQDNVLNGFCYRKSDNENERFHGYVVNGNAVEELETIVDPNTLPPNREQLFAYLNACISTEDIDISQHMSNRINPNTIIGAGGVTGIIAAAEAGNEKVVKDLVSLGADINARTVDKYTALAIACGKDHYRIAEFLLDQGAQTSSPDGQDAPLLMYTANNGNLALAQRLIAANASVNQASDDGVTALYVAAQKGYTDLVDLLIKSGADVDYMREDGFTALLVAGSKNNTDAARLLINAGADIHVDIDGFPLIFYAIRSDNMELVKLLLDRGVPVDIRETYLNDESLLDYAVRESSYACMDYLSSLDYFSND